MRRAIVLAALLGCVGCEREPRAHVPTTVPTPTPEQTGTHTAPPPPPWRMTGELLGATSTHAIILTTDIISVDVVTGDVVARAVTASEDPVPSFDGHLPRHGAARRDEMSVDRLADRPTYVGGEVVVFMRGDDDVVTSLVGLDTSTLEEAWTLEVAYQRPVRSCRTDAGVVLIPGVPAPARFVDWLGQQVWLRELGNGEVREFRCGGDRVAVVIDAGKGRYRHRTFEAATGDLITEEFSRSRELSLLPRESTPLGVEQVGPEVIQVTLRN